MAIFKIEHTSAVLISPEHLMDGQSILESLHITRSKAGVDYSNHKIDEAELLRHYANLPEQAVKALEKFEKGLITLQINEIKKKFQSQRLGISYEIYHKNSMSRFLHGLFASLQPFAGIIKWYHKVSANKNRFKTAPCTFSGFKPQLQFEAVRHQDEIRLETEIVLNGNTFGIRKFNRFHFLLESRNEYFILSYKDYQTLEWLAESSPEKYGSNQQEFSKQILSKLEADYPVNRNNLFAKSEITTIPVNRIALSEISNSFLVLTPQWVYDGIVVEGAWKTVYETTLQGEHIIICRHRDTESAFLRIIESLHPNFSRQLNGYYYLSFADAQKKQWFLKTYHSLLAQNIQLVGMDMLLHFRYSPHQVSASATIGKSEGNSVHIRMKVSFGQEEVPLPELQKIIVAGQRSVLLKDGSLGILQDEWLHQFGTMFRHGKIAANAIQVPRWFAFLETETTEETNVLKPIINGSWWEKWKQWQRETNPVYALPASLQATLRPYQKRGFEWMVLLSEAGAGACLADDMGLGKTLQTICFIAYQLEKDPAGKHLIVCPSSLIYNWQQELQKFSPGITTIVYHGPGRKSSDLQDAKSQVVITSYGTVRSDIEQISALQFGVAVLDESHNIKNPAALTTRAAGQLRAATRIALSGTPLMNNTFDLYAQLNFILPGMFGSVDFFKREYADSIDRDHDPEKILALKKLTAPFILRRTKQQVAKDLPEKTEMVMWCDMGVEQKMLYDDIKISIRDSLFLNIKNDGLNKSKLAILHGMLKLRQVCNSPLLLPEAEQTCSDSVKTDVLINELANNLKNHKVLIFSQFASMLNLLARACTGRGLQYYHFDGQTPPAKRFEMVNNFQAENNAINIFLISLKAGNTGLNLTAADYVFLFDPWWNTAVQQQAIDRTHRIGQTKNVFAYKMICKDTIEERIIRMQERKKKLAEDLVSEDEGFVQSLSEEDIAFLFS